MTPPQRSIEGDWTLRLLIVLLGIAAPFVTLGLISAIPFGIGFVAWLFSIICIAFGLALFTVICYKLLPALRGSSNRSARVSLIFAILTPVISTTLFLYLPVFVSNIALQRNYMTTPEWITDRQEALEDFWRTNPSLQPWHDVLPNATEMGKIRYTISPRIETLSTFDSSTDNAVEYYKKSKMLELSEVDGNAYVNLYPFDVLTSFLNVDLTFHREAEAQVNGLSAAIFDSEVKDTYFEVLSCQVSQGTQRIILQLTSSFPDIRAQKLTPVGEVGNRMFDEHSVQIGNRRLIIDVSSPTYEHLALDGHVSDIAKLHLSRENPLPEVSLTFNFWFGLKACLQKENVVSAEDLNHMRTSTAEL